MNKDELTALVSQIMAQLPPRPAVKGGNYPPTEPQPEVAPPPQHPGDFVPDITQIDLRKLYLTEHPADGSRFAAMRARTSARLGSGRAGARYKTLTMLRFRADHAAAQDAVFSELDAEFAKKNGLVPLQTRCRSKEEYLTRPDLGRTFDAQNAEVIRGVTQSPPTVQIVVGDGLSSSAISANAMDFLAALKDGLKARNISTGRDFFVKYCRVGAGDAIGDLTKCRVVCVLVGERPGLATDKSMSAYITYAPHTGISESCRTVISNIHDQGTPAVEAGAYAAELLETILQKGVSGVGLHLEAAQ